MQENSRSVSSALQEIKCEIMDREIKTRAKQNKKLPRNSIAYQCDYCFPYCGASIFCGALLVADILNQPLQCCTPQGSTVVQGGICGGSTCVAIHECNPGDPLGCLQVCGTLGKIGHYLGKCICCILQSG